MGNVNYLEQYFLGKISIDEAVEKALEQIGEHVSMYIAGAVNFMEFLRDYYDGEPVYPSEMEMLLLSFLKKKFGDEVNGPED